MADDDKFAFTIQEFCEETGGDVDFSKIKSPYTIGPVPARYLPFLAQIALLWRMFERSFDDFFFTMLNFNSKSFL